ncbi:MAG: hypothetical protein IRZ03_18795 [Acidobacterium ailaaui]|nr:hypothetical protein [Pseudacidobacterium ailaaui]
MIKTENIGGIQINVEEALQYLAGVTKITEEGGFYELQLNAQGEHLSVTVDYERTESNSEKELAPIGRKCIFNELYSFDVYGQNPFSFEQLIEDLHAQHLEAVENWLAEFLAEKCCL